MTSKIDEKYILFAADSIAALRKADVFRVLDSVRSDNIDGVTRTSLASFISQHRPDLKDEVTEVMHEEFPADAWKAEEAAGDSESRQRAVTRVAAEPLTIAYIASGARDALRECSSIELGMFDGELGFIGAAINHALFVDTVSDLFDATGDHPGVFAYEVASPFGLAIARAMIAAGNTDPDPSAVLAAVMIDAGYSAAKVTLAIQSAASRR
ncbi:hypothetical protein KAF44_29780 (plasmid) [Cupriavidus necator]|nr:hypothetical protein KAF44_29780 [Cupriavidus necator]